ncbi:MAG: RHS repeat domain-containing protein, partial [Pyrinomonadaceae bacterium]
NGKWETTQFNNRLQPTQIGLGASASSQNLLKLNYAYNTNGNADNNGNVLSQTITVPTVGANQGFIATQTYTYDSLNRIKDVVELIGTTETWRETFLYDRYGNRTFDTTANRTTTIPAGCSTAVCNPSVDPATNKLIGYQFDNAGNTKVDANGQTFIYDAENKQVQVNNAQGIVGQYFYNGDGQRIKKLVPSTGETTVFVYDASNRVVAEYSTIVEPQATAKISYLTSDHLGSPRINTDGVGQVNSRRDFRPFGEEIARTNYGGDSVRQKFTGYERDNEIDLDFAQARYFSSRLGRFYSVDPLMASATVSQPQTWNRYTYVGNNPLKYIDISGKDYDDLKGKRKEIVDNYFAEQAKKDNKTVKELYDGLKDDQKLHYEGITNALEKTKLYDKDGKETGKTALDFVKGLDIGKLGADGQSKAINGFDGGHKGNQSYRIYVTFEDGAVDMLAASNKNFSKSSASKHEGMAGGFRESGDPKLQILYREGKSRGEIDIDFDHDFKGYVNTIIPGGSRGALDVNNSNINHGNHKKEYERKYGQIPRKQ